MSYQSTVLADSPTWLLRLNEPSGTSFTDTQGFLPAGTYTSCTLGQPTLGAGIVDTCVSFNGTSSTAISGVSGSSITPSNPSCEAWFKVASLPGANAAVATGAVAADSRQNWAIVLLPTGAVRVNFQDDATFQTLQATTNTTPVVGGSVYHVAAVLLTTTTMGIYVNGSLQAITYNLTNPVSSVRLKGAQIGVSNGGSFFAGFGSSAAAYPSVLSGTRVLAHYNAGITGGGGGGTSNPASLLMGM